MKQVREWLYIGTSDDAGVFLCGAKVGFTHILSLAPVCLEEGCKFIRSVPEYRQEPFDSVERKLMEKCPDMVGKPPIRKLIPLLDDEKQDILAVLRVCLDFIHQGVEEGIVLVHCIGGVSRSASVVLAYLMESEGLSLDEALESLKRCREGVRPNAGFIKQLRAFESDHLHAVESTKDSNLVEEQTVYTCRLCKKTMTVPANVQDQEHTN